jgi:hypothetical protein
MKLKYIKNNEIYLFKSWEQMEQEFGLNYNNFIDCMYFFTTEMKFLCGKKFKREGYYDYYNKNGVWKKIERFSISSDMLTFYHKNKRID